MIKETIDLLGRKASDKVTGLSGVVTSVCFDLYGCVQAAVTPPAVDNEVKNAGSWFDVNRLTVTDERVLPVPQFEAKNNRPENYTQGAAEKPCPR